MQTEIEYLKQFLNKEDIIVIACSGGPDSMCLLTLLVNLKEEKKLQIICAHINHNLRKESKEEYQFVKSYCEAKKIIFEGTKFEEYKKGNFHANAHQKRRNFYEEIIKKYHANYLMTAHHGDDLTETILMRLTRGSSIKGYAGFSKIQKEATYTIVRPLITATKKQILEYNEKEKIPYRIDKSNESNKYTRNRYRHQILPFLKKENEMVHHKFLKFSLELCRIDEFLVKFVDNALTNCLEFDNLLVVEMKKLDLFIQREVLKKYLKKIYQDDIILLKDKHLDNIIKLIHSSKSNSYIHLPKNKIAKKSYDFFKVENVNKKEDFLIELNDIMQTKEFTICKIQDASSTNNDIIRLNSQEIHLPIFVRNRKKEDFIETKNLNGRQKLKKVFIDKKIPIEQRDKWPIVVDSKNQILWIPGLKKSKFDKEKNEKYDIIYKYDLSKEKNYVTKK